MTTLPTNKQEKERGKTTKLYWTTAGRKGRYLAIEEGKCSVVPAIYFRKSKWITEKKFNELLDLIHDNL